MVNVDNLGEGPEEERGNPDLLAFFAEQDNLVGEYEELDDERVNEIGTLCHRGFEEDWQSEAEWRDDVEKIHKIVEQEKGEKTSPWPNASNVNFPLMLNAILQFNARSYATLLNNSNIAIQKVIGSDDGIPQTDEQGQPVAGPDGQPAWEVPPGAKQQRAERVSKHMNYQLTEEMEEWEEDHDKLLIAVPTDGCGFKKVYFDPDLGRNVSELVVATDFVINDTTKNLVTCPRMSHITAYYPNEIQEKVAMGLWADPELELREGYFDPEEFVEQYTYLDLDGDDYSEPYIVTYHRETAKVVRIKANFDVEDIQVVEDQVAKVTPKRYFVKYECFPNPSGGFKGHGFGHLLLHINESVNTIINQLIDAGTLANMGGGFISKNFRIKGGKIRFDPAEFKRVDVMGGNLRDGILPLPINEPSQTLFVLLGLLIDSGKELASIQDVLTGGGSENAAVGTTLALIEQGMKVYTSIFKRLYRAERDELRLLYALNTEFLDDQVYRMILDEPQAIQNSDYDPSNMDIAPAADPNMATDIQRTARAQALQSFVGRPWINGMEIDRETMEAMNIADPDRFLIPPSDEPTPEELMAMAELRLKEMDSKSKAYKALSEMMLNLQKVEEAGGDAIVNADEMAVVVEKAEQAGILPDEQNSESGGL